MPENTIIIEGPIYSWTAEDVRFALNSLDGQPVTVEISSPGGFVFPGLTIFNLLKNYSGNVTTHIMGLAASMASYLALAGDKITAEANAVFMIHNVQGGAQGDHNTMRKAAETFESLSNLIAKTYAERSGKSVSQIRDMMDDETFLFGKEIKTAGFVDEIVGACKTKKAKPKNEAIATAKLEIENCFALINAEEKEANDIDQIAACIKNDLVDQKTKTLPLENKNELIVNNKQTEDKIMNLDELKAKHPDLVKAIADEAMERGITQERDRVKAHLTLAESSGDLVFAITCINDGKDTTDQNVIATYMAAGMKNKALENHADDGNATGNLETDTSETDEEKQAKDLLDMVMNNSKVKESDPVAMENPAE